MFEAPRGQGVGVLPFAWGMAGLLAVAALLLAGFWPREAPAQPSATVPAPLAPRDQLTTIPSLPGAAVTMYAGGREERSSLPRWAAATYYRAVLQLQGWRFAYGDRDSPWTDGPTYYFTYCKDGVAAQVVMSQSSRFSAERTDQIVTFSVPNCV